MITFKNCLKTVFSCLNNEHDSIIKKEEGA